MSGLRQAVKNSVFPRGPRIATIPFGLYRGLRFHLDFASDTQMWLGLGEIETYGVIKPALANAQWMIDVGAGRGELALLFATQGIATIAMEPGANETSLHENLALNAVPKPIDVIELCASDHIDTRHTTLDRLSATFSGRGFIKIDVDGAEVEVLRGASQTLARRSAEFLVEVHSRTLEQSCLDLMARAGYRTTIIDQAWWRSIIREYRSPETRWFSAAPR